MKGVIDLLHLQSVALSYGGEEVPLGDTEEGNGSSPTGARPYSESNLPAGDSRNS